MSNNSICEEITQWSHLHVGFHTSSVFNKTLHIPRGIDKLPTLAFDTCWIRRVRSNEVLSRYEHPRLYNKRTPRLTLIYKTTHEVILVRPIIFVLNFARTDCLAIACMMVSFNLFSGYISKWTALNCQASSQEVWEWSVQQHSLSQENLEHLYPTLRLIGSHARHWNLCSSRRDPASHIVHVFPHALASHCLHWFWMQICANHNCVSDTGYHANIVTVSCKTTSETHDNLRLAMTQRMWGTYSDPHYSVRRACFYLTICRKQPLTSRH